MRFYNREVELSILKKQGAIGTSVGHNNAYRSSLTCVIAEIKRNPKKLSLPVLQVKTKVLSPLLKGYKVEYRLLSLDDMCTINPLE